MSIIIKNCKLCGQEFKRRINKSRIPYFCSRACAMKNALHCARKQQKCKHCGKLFLAKHGRHIACCLHHTHLYRIKNKIGTKECLQCNKTFIPRLSTSIFCSVMCRRKYFVKERHWSWKTGKVMKRGYVLVHAPKNHPFAWPKGWMFEHRLVMEKYFNRRLYPWEFIHHKNGVKHDNRIENLVLVTKRIHHGEVLCPYCQKKFLIR